MTTFGGIKIPANCTERRHDLRRLGDLTLALPISTDSSTLQRAARSDADRAACGFPSPAATCVVRASGDSMTGAGIFPGDIAVVNRARNAVSGCIVLALVDGKFTIKRYLVREHCVLLHAENPSHPDIVISEGREFEVCGA